MEGDEKLVEAVRGFPCLWQVRTKAYRDLTAKENAWKQVAEQVADTIPECQRKWKLLRDKYVRELRKIKGSSSGDAGPPYVSCWPLFHIMGFLETTVQHKRTETNFSQDPQEPPAEVEVNASEDISTNTDKSPSVPPSHASLDDGASPQIRTGKKRKSVPHDEVEDAFLQHLREKAEERKKRQEDTDNDHFGRHVAAVLKRLPNRAKAIARLNIEQVLMDVEFPEPHSFSTPYSNY